MSRKSNKSRQVLIQMSLHLLNRPLSSSFSVFLQHIFLRDDLHYQIVCFKTRKCLQHLPMSVRDNPCAPQDNRCAPQDNHYEPSRDNRHTFTIFAHQGQIQQVLNPKCIRVTCTRVQQPNFNNDQSLSQFFLKMYFPKVYSPRVYFFNVYFPMCIYPKCMFAKCTRLACLLSFASLFVNNMLIKLAKKILKISLQSMRLPNLHTLIIIQNSLYLTWIKEMTA